MLDTKQEQATINATELIDLLGGASLCAHSKDDAPILNTVRLSIGNGKAIAAATDRYRLIEGTIEAEGELKAVNIALADVKQVIAHLKSAKVALVNISRDGEMIRFATLSGGVNVRTVDGTFPPYLQLFPAEDQPLVPVERMAFNPSFMADYGKIAGKRPQIIIQFYGDNKGAMIEIKGSTKVEWRSLLMPMRVA
jgi:DNA polymerase III sliding clamp (beta) subunit (PCNA family)